LKNVAPYVRDEAEPVVFPFSGECSIQSPVGKERKEEQRG
jgi:hypothetical protein